MSRVLFGPSLSVNLAFLSGYADTVAFVHMKGLFVAHITGNFVLLGASFVALGADHGLGAGDLLKMLAFPVFLVSAGLAAVIAGFIPKERQTPVLLWLTAILVAAVGAGALWPGQWDAWLAMVLVVAMGVLNATHRMDTRLGPPFTVMTGNVTSVAIEAVRRLRLGPDEPQSPAPTTTRAMALLIAGFALGCALGAGSQLLMGFGAMLLPALVLAYRLWRG